MRAVSNGNQDDENYELLEGCEDQQAAVEAKGAACCAYLPGRFRKTILTRHIVSLFNRLQKRELIAATYKQAGRDEGAFG